MLDLGYNGISEASAKILFSFTSTQMTLVDIKIFFEDIYLVNKVFIILLPYLISQGRNEFWDDRRQERRHHMVRLDWLRNFSTVQLVIPHECN